MSLGKNFTVHARQNVISFAGDQTVERLAGSTFYQSTAVLLPNAYAVRMFREYLQKRLATIGGMRLHTPASLRQELLGVRHLGWAVLPAENLIPWQIENGFSPGAVHEIQQLRPHERDQLCPNPLWARAEAEKLLTPAAMDIQLCSAVRDTVWDQFLSVGFPEGSWENHYLLREASKYANTIEHFFELMAKSHSVNRWRTCWNYQPDGEVIKKVSGDLEVYTVGNVTDFSFVVLGKIASILGQWDPSSGGEFPKIAIGFARRGTCYHALRQRLKTARIPFLDLLNRGKIADWSPLWQRWLEYQGHQKREECLALLDCKFALGLMEEIQWAELCQCVLEHSRRNATDDCGEMLPMEVKKWVQPLPAHGKVEKFWQSTVEVFPQLRCLTSGAETLGTLYDTVTSEGFLGWLGTAVENQFRESPPKNWAANVHIVGYGDLPFCDLDHVICGNWEGNEPTNCAEIFGGMDVESINESLEDFCYDFSTQIVPAEMIIRNVLERIGKVTVVTVREIDVRDTDRPAIAHLSNRLDTNEMCERGRHLRRLGIFFNDTEGETESAGPNLCGDDVGRCVDAYHQRRDTARPFGIYDFGAGGNEKWREELLRSIPCKAWELAFERPEEVWMRQILHIKMFEKSVFDEIAMLMGTGVHAELAKKFVQSVPIQNTTEYAPFTNLNGTNYITYSILHQLHGITCALKKQAQGELTGFDTNSIKAEQNISSFVNIGPARIWARGRVDLVANEGSDYCVIDFKTRPAGTAFTVAQVSQGKFLQIILYGLYYQCAGRAVGMRILSPFQRPRSFEFSKLKPKDLEKIDIFFSNFEKLQRTLNFGYGAPKRFLAYAHCPLPEHVVAIRRSLSGFVEVASDDS
ncbi:MAG: PD-(D/E)XK nuclease family protein [Puniceicoccales bacterium]|jgi:hypothetical protein|nr:PD-(D/E)XK nuclease family protein [Puniceicoccales bacterium]